MAYDLLRKQDGQRAHKEYLKILYLAAKETETGVNEALRWLIELEQPISAAAVKERLGSGPIPASLTAVCVAEINLAMYDVLLHQEGLSG